MANSWKTCRRLRPRGRVYRRAREVAWKSFRRSWMGWGTGQRKVKLTIRSH